ncbi:MAG: hypothetical protein HY902_08080 [Deltaproteobacteria bacterium]|nr:hypothetical protein [Deltaproteobacteria bacterium]
MRQTRNDIRQAKNTAAAPDLPVGPWPAERPLQLWATALEGLGAIAARELASLASAVAQTGDDLSLAVAPAGLVALLARARTVEQILVQLGSTKAETATDLDGLAGWLCAGWLPADADSHVKVHTVGCSADRARWVQANLQRRLPKGAGAKQVLHLRVLRDRVEVALDPAGWPLHQRGYRLEPGEAPLRETVAAALLQWAGMQAGMNIWDPTCGSATLPIEGLLLHQPLARDWACRQWSALPPQQAPEPGPVLARGWAGDMSAEAVERARRNVERAGLAEFLTLQHAEMAQWRQSLGEFGMVVGNLPWGLRLGQRADARRTAQRWAAVVRRSAAGWRAAVVVAEPQLADILGLDDCESLRCRAGGHAVWLVRGTVRRLPPTGAVP